MIVSDPIRKSSRAKTVKEDCLSPTMVCEHQRSERPLLTRKLNTDRILITGSSPGSIVVGDDSEGLGCLESIFPYLCHAPLAPP